MPSLVIREEQMRAFERAQEQPFLASAAAYIRSQYPEITAGFADAELLRRVELAFGRASQFGFTSQASALGFMVLMFTVGPEFDSHPSIREILSQSGDSIPPDARLAYLADAISPEEWEEARAGADESFWNRGPFVAAAGESSRR
jgi:hypothetical protein